MKDDRNIDREPITLDQSELLGLSQIAKISPETAKSGPAELSRLLSKIGEVPPLVRIRS